MLDDILLGDPLRRLLFGLSLLLLAALGIGLAHRAARRTGKSLRVQQTGVRVAVTVTPVALGIVFSAFWGLLGAIVFTGVAIAVFGIGVVVLLVRGT